MIPAAWSILISFSDFIIPRYYSLTFLQAYQRAGGNRGVLVGVLEMEVFSVDVYEFDSIA